MAKKKPEFEMLEDTPLPEKAGHGQAQVQKGHVVIQMDMTEEEYYNLLRSKPQLTADELNWISKNQHRFLPAPQPKTQSFTPPAESPEAEFVEATELEPAQPEQPVEKQSLIQRLKEQELDAANKKENLDYNTWEYNQMHSGFLYYTEADKNHSMQVGGIMPTHQQYPDILQEK